MSCPSWSDNLRASLEARHHLHGHASLEARHHLDMEIAHNTILELKVAPRVTAADKAQLMKYVRAKQACGMRLEHAAVVCFRDDGYVEIQEMELGKAE